MTAPYYGPEPAAYWQGREYDPDADPLERDDYEDDRRDDDAEADSMLHWYGID